MPNREHRQRFVQDVLAASLDPEAPAPVLNLLRGYTRFLEHAGFDSLSAHEQASLDVIKVLEVLEAKLADWDAQGVPRPLIRVEDRHTFISWLHKEYLRYSGAPRGLDVDYCKLLSFVQGTDSRQFLVVCALWLKCLGVREIRVVDAKGDGGVDLLAVVADGPLRSLIVAVQAKTSTGTLDRSMVFEEFGKFSMLPQTKMYSVYRSVLSLDEAQDGAPWCYGIFTNSGFDSGARAAAGSLGIMLRSGRQIAYNLRKCHSAASVVAEVERLTPHLRGNPRVDLLREIDI